MDDRYSDIRRSILNIWTSGTLWQRYTFRIGRRVCENVATISDCPLLGHSGSLEPSN